MSVSGPGASRFDPAIPTEPAADEAATSALVNDLEATRGAGPSWLSFMDSARGLRPLARKLSEDGTIDADDVKALVKEAKDFGGLTAGEKDALKRIVRDFSAKFTPEAREALARFLGMSATRPSAPAEPPQPTTPATPTAPSGPLASVNAKLPEVAGKRYELQADGTIKGPAGEAKSETLYRAGAALVEAPRGVLRGAGAEAQKRLLDNVTGAYDEALRQSQGSDVQRTDALKARSGAAAAMLAVIEGADSPQVMNAAAGAYLDRALGEPDERLRASMYRNIEPLKGTLSSEQARKVAELKARVIPDTPPYDEWFKDGNKTLEVRQYAHDECWMYGTDPITAWKQQGLTVTREGTENGEKFWELSGKIADPTGRNPPQQVHVKVYKTHDEFMRDMDDPNVHAVFYTGHSNLGGNVSEAIRRGPEENGKKLIHLGLCRGQQNIFEVANKYPHAHLSASKDPHYFHNMMGVVTNTVRGIAARESWEAIDRRSNVESRNFIRPHEMRRYEYVDEDRDGKAEITGAGRDRFYDVIAHTRPATQTDLKPRAERRPAEDIDGTPIMDGVNFARTLLTYHVEHLSPGERSNLKHIVGDRIVADRWFDGPESEAVRIKEERGADGETHYKVSINKNLAGQSDFALGALVQFEFFKQQSMKAAGGTFTADDKARALIATGEYLSYMYCTSEEADAIMKAVGEKVGIRNLTYDRVRQSIDVDDHGYVTEKQASDLVRRLNIR